MSSSHSKSYGSWEWSKGLMYFLGSRGENWCWCWCWCWCTLSESGYSSSIANSGFLLCSLLPALLPVLSAFLSNSSGSLSLVCEALHHPDQKLGRIDFFDDEVSGNDILGSRGRSYREVETSSNDLLLSLLVSFLIFLELFSH